MRLYLTMVIFLQGLTAFGQDGNSGIVYGKNHAFSLTAPNGWVLDNKSGVSQGLHAVFYERGQSWDKAQTVMYANTASLEDEEHRTLDKLIEYDLQSFSKNYSDLRVTNGKDIKIKDNVVAKVKYLSGPSYGNYEAIAYIDAGKTGVMIIMTSRAKDGFENSLAAFETLVKSYMFIAEEVVIKEKE